MISPIFVVEMVILHEAEIVLDRNEEDDEEEEVNDDAWNDRGSDRLILEALAGDSTTHAQGGGATSSLPANNNINASSATSGPNNAQFTSVATQFLPHVPSH